MFSGESESERVKPPPLPPDAKFRRWDHVPCSELTHGFPTQPSPRPVCFVEEARRILGFGRLPLKALHCKVIPPPPRTRLNLHRPAGGTWRAHRESLQRKTCTIIRVRLSLCFAVILGLNPWSERDTQRSGAATLRFASASFHDDVSDRDDEYVFEQCIRQNPRSTWTTRMMPGVRNTRTAVYTSKQYTWPLPVHPRRPPLFLHRSCGPTRRWRS